MKIAFLMYSFIPLIGGAQIFAYNIIKGFLENNHSVHLYLPYKAYLNFKEYNKINNLIVIPILRYEHFIARYLPELISKRLIQAQKRHQYDVWQVIGTYPSGWVAKKLSNIVPVILRSHGDDIQKDKKLNYGTGLNPNLNNKIGITLSKMTHLIALTETVKKCYKEYGIPETKITEIPNGVSIERFNQKVASDSLRNKYGIKNDQLFILTVGRYHIKKGYEYIPGVAKILKNNGFSFRWVIVGKGVKILQSTIIERDVSELVLLVDEIGLKNSNEQKNIFNLPDDVLIQLYKSADLFVMPSLLETFGMVLIEAMAAGLPVITTNSPGCRDVVTHGYNGLLVEPGNVTELANSIIKMIKSPQLKESLLRNSKNSIIRYGWRNIAREYEHLYYDLISKEKLKTKN